MKTTKKTNKKRTVIILLLGAVVVVCGSYSVVAYRDSLWPFQVNEQSAPSNGLEDSQQAKRDLIEDKKKPTTTDKDESGKTVVSVGVAYAGVADSTVEVRAFVPGVIEGNGTCTATFTNGDATVTAKSDAFIDATSSQCEPIDLPTSDFIRSGMWKLTVTYSSPASTGTSEAIEVTLP